jgi:hypothetical protein
MRQKLHTCAANFSHCEKNFSHCEKKISHCENFFSHVCKFNLVYMEYKKNNNNRFIYGTQKN